MPNQLDAKERRFVDEYLIDLDVERAGEAAGYSPTMARSKCYQWVSNGKVKPHVFEAIQIAMAKRSARTEITADRVLREFAKLGFADIGDIVSWGTKEVAFGFDDEGRKLPPDQIGDAVLIRHEQAPFVEAIPSDQLPDDVRVAVSEVALTKDGLKIKMHDKAASLAQIARHLGMFKDRVELTGKDGKPLQAEVHIFDLPNNGRDPAPGGSSD